MRKITLALAIASLGALAACKKTGDNTYEVQKPVVGTTTDTVHTPDVDVGTKTDTVTTPNVDVKVHQDTHTVKVPTVRVGHDTTKH